VQDSEIIKLDLPATFKYLNVLGACVAEMLMRVENLDEPAVLTYNVQLALQEVCTNIVRHAYEDRTGGRIELTMKVAEHPRQLIIDVHDTGRSFDLATVPEPNLDEGEEHGYGLFLVRTLLDEVVYDPRPRKNHWRLVKNL
jgi:serine/threonine-protein kinase RsbW